MCIGRVFAMVCGHSGSTVDTFHCICVLLCLQIQAKIVLVRLLQTYTLTLPDDYTIRDGLDVTLHPIGGIPCTIKSRKSCDC